jgi:hypothetical protein
MTKLRMTLLGTLVLALAACGTARLISRDQTGGVIALDGDRGKAMEQASQMMTANCNGPYNIVSEGEQVIGTDTSQEQQTYVTKDGRMINSGDKSTRNATEWRVKYACGAAAPPVGSPPPLPPPQ